MGKERTKEERSGITEWNEFGMDRETVEEGAGLGEKGKRERNESGRCVGGAYILQPGLWADETGL